MLEIPEEVLENLPAALTRMNIGFVLDGTVEAALYVMRENRLEREREKLAALEEPPILREWEEGEEDADRASPGVPVASPVEPLRAPPTGLIPLGRPSLPPAHTPQEEECLPTTKSTLEEMEAALQKFRERDRECQRARAEIFAAFQTWMEGHPEAPKAAKNWWRLVEDKQEEDIPPTGPPLEPRPVGRKPWKRRPRGKTRKKWRPDAARRPGRNWRGSERSG